MTQLTKAYLGSTLLNSIKLGTTDVLDALGAGYDAFLLIGQSNMVGRASPIDPTLDATNPRIFQYGNNSDTISIAQDPLDHLDEQANDIGLGLSFAKAYLATIPSDRDVLLIPCADGGTAFGTGFWRDGGTGYENAIAQANAAMQQGSGTNRFRGILWHQGESDSNGGFSTAQYLTDLTALANGMRTEITTADDTTPFICGALFEGRYPLTDNVQIALQQAPDNIPYSAYVSATGLTSFDNLHFDAASLRTFGNRYHAQLANAQANAPAVPDAIDDLTATENVTEVDLSWTAPEENTSPITDYVIQYKQSSSGTWLTFNDGTGTGLTETVTGLTASTQYDFRVAAVNGIGQGDFSNVATVTTGSLSVPDAVDDLAASTDDGEVTLTWTAPPDGGAAITDYVVEFKTLAAGSWSTFSDGTSEVTGATVTSLTNGTEYQFRVYAVNSEGQSAASNVVNATPDVNIAEANAIRHYLFGNDNTNMQDLKTSNQLTPLGTTPTHNAGFLSLAAELLNGCESDWGVNETELTMCVVFRTDSTETGFICGNLTFTSRNEGCSIFTVGGTDMRVNVRGGINSPDLGTISNSQFYFAALSINEGVSRLDYLGDATTPITATSSAVFNENTQTNLGIGDTDYNSSIDGKCDIAEFIIFDTALSESDLDSVYARTVQRMSDRGITVT